jgi:hypothetical protein
LGVEAFEDVAVMGRLIASGFFLFAETLRESVGQLKDGP